MACVMTNPAAYPGGYPPRSVKASQIASLKDGTVVPFDPMTFVASAFKHVPGAILSLGVATHSTCTNEEPIEAPESAVPGTMTEEQAAAILEAGAAGSPQSGPDMQLAGVITETAKLLDGSAVVVEGGALKAAGVNEINPAAGGGKKKKRRLLFQRDGGGEVDRDGSGGEGPRRGGEQQKPLRQRRLTQLDSLNPGDGDATSALASKLAEDAVEMVLMGNEGMSPHGYGEFEVKAAAETLTLTKGYSWDTGRDLVEALKNGSWTGEVYFPISGCVMTESKKGYVRELLNTKLGWAVILRGAVLFNKELRASLLEELDTSRTFMGFDFVQLPNGEPLTEREVFVQPVLEDAAAMEGLSDEGKDAAAKFAKEYKQRNPGMGK